MTDKTDDYLRHEALHMSSFLMSTIDRELMEHSYIQSDSECLTLANKAHQALFDLYQLIGNKD